MWFKKFVLFMRVRSFLSLAYFFSVSTKPPCIQGNSTPNIPPPLYPLSASRAGFEGSLVHSSMSYKRFDEIIER